MLLLPIRLFGDAILQTLPIVKMLPVPKHFQYR
jgi:hypothetical protein